MIVHNGNIVVNNGRWIIPPKVYNVILNQTDGGTITANPMKGISGTTVTLSNSPTGNHEFVSYNVSGSTLYDNNKFDIHGSDVIVSANWKDPFEVVNMRDYWFGGGDYKVMKYNLAVDDGGPGIYHTEIISNGINLGTQYYYTYEAAYRIALSLSEWILPDSTELRSIFAALDYITDELDRPYIYVSSRTDEFRSTYGWNKGKNGTDLQGFNALPCGTGTLNTVGEIASYWSSSDYSSNTNKAYCVRLSPYSTEVLPISKSSYSQVRLIKVS